MTRILAIDPGPKESGWCVIDAATHKPVAHGKMGNLELLANLWGSNDFHSVEHVGIEMIASYGMAVGKDVFETCVWIGRFTEPICDTDFEYVYRRDVKLHHCASVKANDSNIRQALVDRFACGQPNHGKGTKSEPGWFHGFRADIWQAYALAVYVADSQEAAA